MPPPAEPADDLVSTHHTIRIGRRSLSYTATAGRVVLREEKLADGKYQGSGGPGRDVPDQLRRWTAPIRQAAGRVRFNGGPGSSSVWLHLGLLGPAPDR